MGVNATRTKMLFDSSAAVVLRSPGAAALAAGAATTTETAVALNALRTAYWHNQEVPQGIFRVGVDVVTWGGTTPTLTLNLRLTDDGAAANLVVIGSYVILAVGYYEFDVDSKSLPLLSPSATTKFLAISAVTTGSALTMKYSAWIGKCLGA